MCELSHEYTAVHFGACLRELLKTLSPYLAEASCASVIRTAQAAVEELQSAVPASVEKWAGCALSNSERDVHRVARTQGLTLPVPLTDIKVQKRIS